MDCLNALCTEVISRWAWHLDNCRPTDTALTYTLQGNQFTFIASNRVKQCDSIDSARKLVLEYSGTRDNTIKNTLWPNIDISGIASMYLTTCNLWHVFSRIGSGRNTICYSLTWLAPYSRDNFVFQSQHKKASNHHANLPLEMYFQG